MNGEQDKLSENESHPFHRSDWLESLCKAHAVDDPLDLIIDNTLLKGGEKSDE
ncbi:hypothetical protein M316_0071 [Nitrincola phage 1M3-16]|uniref:hypothetical protein n=1 Tax=Nitrincola phage 1M3-16 TaxID=1472912 RepID=UPI000444EBE1|nr:hypothetical protein GJ22_gp081 [Nitrincola phage 1M3-16]AHX01136.1 hypothetical protein M316_0071 [Nitrincola phage 1M3-16]